MLVTEAGQSFPVGPTEQEVKEQKEEKKKTFVFSCGSLRSCYRLCSIVPEHTSIYIYRERRVWLERDYAIVVQYSSSSWSYCIKRTNHSSSARLYFICLFFSPKNIQAFFVQQQQSEGKRRQKRRKLVVCVVQTCVIARRQKSGVRAGRTTCCGRGLQS
jgi:hypothetical protein